MKKPILEAIRDHNLNKANRSIAGQQAYDTAVHNKTAEFKRLLKGEVTQDSDPRLLTASDLARMYYMRLAEFTGKPCMVDFSKMNKRAIAYWHRVYNFCKENNVDPNAHISSQFFYFNRTFGTSPKLEQLMTPKSLERTKECKTEQKRVVPFARDANLDLGALYGRCDKQVRDMCRAQGMSRLEFYKEIVLTGAVQLPLDFLSADPVYQRATEEA